MSRNQEFRNRVEDGVKWWWKDCMNPYVDAYQAAYDGFKQTLNDQAEVDKRNAELAVLAACVVTGSLLVATVGAASMRVLARRQALRYVANNNLQRTYRNIRDIATHDVTTFAIGKITSEAKSSVKKEAQKIVAKTIGSTPNRLTTSPMSLKLQMESVLLGHALCANLTADAIEKDSSLSEAEKNAHYAILRQAAIVRIPEGSINKEKLAKQIELSMYMSYILDLDSLIEVPLRTRGGSVYGTGELGQEIVNPSKSRRIDIMPSHPQYPKATSPKIGPYTTSAHQYVAIDQAGSRIVRKTNELYAQVIGGTFFTRTGIFERSTSPAELQKAESTLYQLGNKTSPTASYLLQA